MALWPLAGCTVLLLLGLFGAWQTWLIADEGNAIQRVHVAQDEAVKAVSAEIASQRAAVEKVLTAVDPAPLMSNPVQSAAALRQIGRASCRARACQYVSISVVSVSFKKKHLHALS